MTAAVAMNRAKRGVTGAVSAALLGVAVAGIVGPSRTRHTSAVPLRPQVTPVGAIARGAAAGLIGTLAMDVWQYTRYRREHGTEQFPQWELSSDVTAWDKAPAPAQVGRRIVEGLFERKLPDSRAALVNNVMHWGYGVSGAVAYGVIAAFAPQTSSQLRADTRNRDVGRKLRHPAGDAPVQAHQ